MVTIRAVRQQAGDFECAIEQTFVQRAGAGSLSIVAVEHFPSGDEEESGLSVGNEIFQGAQQLIHFFLAFARVTINRWHA